MKGEGAEAPMGVLKEGVRGDSGWETGGGQRGGGRRRGGRPGRQVGPGSWGWRQVPTPAAGGEAAVARDCHAAASVRRTRRRF